MGIYLKESYWVGFLCGIIYFLIFCKLKFCIFFLFMNDGSEIIVIEGKLWFLSYLLIEVLINILLDLIKILLYDYFLNV